MTDYRYMVDVFGPSDDSEAEENGWYVIDEENQGALVAGPFEDYPTAFNKAEHLEEVDPDD